MPSACDFGPLVLSEFVAGSVDMFSGAGSARQLLEITVFFANEALLSVTATADPPTSRPVYTSPGYALVLGRRAGACVRRNYVAGGRVVVVDSVYLFGAVEDGLAGMRRHLRV
ncbi:uncharacterized protein BJX67DRAFT_384940 [Aspergillus lucknowensis]|uniref:Uncharacterized protein n=1 Tax=Aspergillus lucknowensis TaxID=176173 RepID=A0ABR4LF74_9EURO